MGVGCGACTGREARKGRLSHQDVDVLRRINANGWSLPKSKKKSWVRQRVSMMAEDCCYSRRLV